MTTEDLIAALKTLKARYGDDFVLTMAPETFFVQLGYQYYGTGKWGGQDPRAGAYLPVIHALRHPRHLASPARPDDLVDQLGPVRRLGVPADLRRLLRLTSSDRQISSTAPRHQLAATSSGQW